MRRWSLEHPYLTVLAVAFAVHVALFFGVFGQAYFDVHGTDGSQYRAIADNLLTGNGFSLRHEAPFVPDTLRTPTYPYFLVAVKALTGSYFPSLYLSLLLGLLIPLCGMRLMAFLTEDRRLWLAAGFILTFDLHVWYYSFVYGSEGVFLPLIALAVLFCSLALLRRSWPVSLVAGASLGLATLARPIVQFVPVLFLVFCLAMGWKNERKRMVHCAAVFVVAFAMVVAPWLVRNERTFHVLDYSNVGWFNFYTRVAATAEAIHTGMPYDTMRIAYLQRLHDKGYIDKTPVEEEDVHGYEFKPIFQKETWLTVKQFPYEALVSQLSAFSTVVSQDQHVIFATSLGWVKSYPSFSPFVKLARDGFVPTFVATVRLALGPWGIAIMMRFVWLALFCASLFAPWAAWKRDRRLFPLMLFLLLYDLGIIALSLNAAAQADARYRAQYQFVQVPLALFAIASWWRVRTRERTEEACPSCGAVSFLRPYGKRNGYPVWRCRCCRSVSVLPRPSQETLTAFYGETYFGGAGEGYMDYDADARAKRQTLERYLERLEQQGARGHILDVGAATGAFLSCARDRGWSVVGQEFSEAAAARARAKGLDVRVAPLSDFVPPSFDAVTLLDVIEHVLDPHETLCDVRRLLKPDGVVLLNAPDAGSWVARLMGRRWHAIVPPEHLTLFSARALVRLVESAGFRATWVGRVPKRFRLSYIVSTFARWSGLRACARLANWLEGHPSWNRSIRWPFSDNITIVARYALHHHPDLPRA